MCVLTTFTFLFKLKAALLTKRPKKKQLLLPGCGNSTGQWSQLEDDKTLFTSTTWLRRKKKPKRAETISDPAQSVAVKPDLFPCDSIMHLCRRGPRGRLLLQPCTGPGASLSRLMYVGVSRGPLPVGAGLPPEARLKRPRSLSCVCRLSNSLVYGLH